MPNDIRFNRIKYLLSRIFLWWLDIIPVKKKTLPPRESVKSVLIIQSHLIGDLVMTVPVLRGLKQYYPGSNLYLLASSNAKYLLKYEKAVDEIIPVDFPWSTYNYSPGRIMQFIGKIIYLRKKRIDMAIDLRGDVRNIVAMWLIGADHRVSFGSTGGTSLLTNIVPDNKERHLIDYSMSILKHLGCYDDRKQKPILVYSKEEERSLFEFLSSSGIGRHQYVVINTGASFLSRRWSDQNFSKLAGIIKNKYNIQVVWCFPPGDVPEEYKKKGNVFCSNLSGLMPLLDHALFYIGLDSGVGHMAAAFNVPSVTLFGPQDPELSKPINERLEIVMARAINCRPCGKKNCDKRVSCMDLIEVDEVMVAIGKLEIYFRERITSDKKYIID